MTKKSFLQWPYRFKVKRSRYDETQKGRTNWRSPLWSEGAG